MMVAICEGLVLAGNALLSQRLRSPSVPKNRQFEPRSEGFDRACRRCRSATGSQRIAGRIK